jgi:hypothetical protein
MAIADPFLFFDQNVMHDGDVRRRAPETDPT